MMTFWRHNDGSLSRRRALSRLGGLALSSALLLTGTLGALPSAHAADLQKASLRLKWLTQTQFAGFYVAKAKGFYKDAGIDLTINPGGPNLNADSLVASGADTFGLTGGVESQLASMDKGLPLICIGVSHQITPYVFVAKKESGIKTLEDFKGKTVSTWFSGAQHTLKAMLATRGITEKDFTLQPQSGTMTPFIDGQVDVATATLYNEYQTLLSKGLKDLTIFQPDDYGISVPRDTIVTSKETIEKNPQLVQNFLNATLKGWQYALRHPDEAVDIIMDADPSLDRDHQTRQMSMLKGLMLPKGTKGLLAIPYKKIESAEKVLHDAGAIKSMPDIKSGFDDRFWKAAPDSLKTL